MTRVCRPTRGVGLGMKTSAFFPLLTGVVMHLAQGLQFAFPEQALITLVGNDVVGDCTSGDTACCCAHAAEWFVS